MKKMDDAYPGILRDHGLKVTESRLRIFDILFRSRKPLSVSDVVSALKGIDTVTVYRTLQQFVTAHLASPVHLSHNRAYFEYIHAHHHHLVCTDCGLIADIKECDTSSREKNTLQQAPDFARISSHSLEYFGICKKCANA